MQNETDNPVPSLGDQGSQTFSDVIIPPVGPTGENTQQTSDAGGRLPQKSADDGQQSVTQPKQTTAAEQSQADIIRATAEAVAAAHVRGAQSAAQPAMPSQKDISPEDFAKKYNVTRANEELVATILGNDPKRAALALDQYGQNLVKQAILMTMELNSNELTRFRGEIDPHIQSWQSYRAQQEAVAAEQRFFSYAPDLANEKALVMELKDAFITKVRAGQVQFANENEAFSAVANAARTILKKVNPSWTPTAGNQSGPTGGQQTGRRMSVASSTGRSGTPQATAKSDVESVFGPDAV
jgi:hypothetical protein